MKLLGISQQIVVNVSIIVAIAVTAYISNSALPLLGLFALQVVPVTFATDPGDQMPEPGEYDGGNIGFQ